MQEAAQKFRRYASSVERDIEILLFEMLDLIDSKTRTVRKLMKLHLNVRRVSRITNDQSMIYPDERSSPKHRHSSTSLTSACNSVTETISITESTKDHAGPRLDSMMEVSDFGRCPKTESIHNSAQNIEEVIEDIGNGIKDIQLSETCNLEKAKTNSEALTLATQMVQGLVDDIAEEASNQAQDGIAEEATNPADGVQESPEDHWDEAVTESELVTPEIQHPNSPSNYVEGPFHDSSHSSVHSYSIIVNLEGALNNLEGCQPGECGVYMDSSTYKNVISTLKSAIANYGLICATKDHQENGHRLLGMGRSSTQPVLNVSADDIARRKTCSSTGCEKHARRKRC